MEKFLELDRTLFYFINTDLANPVTNFIMPIITNGDYWMPIYIALFLWLLIKGGKEGRIFFVLLILGVILTDQISATYIKEWVARLRPCKTLDDINLLVNCGAGKSFPSSHAANNFGAAFMLSRYKKNWTYTVFILATLIAISRVFVGVHYPLDIITGAILGSVIGYGLVKLKEVLLDKPKPKEELQI